MLRYQGRSPRPNFKRRHSGVTATWETVVAALGNLMKSTIAAATLHRSRQALAVLAAKRRQARKPAPAAWPAPEKDLFQRLREAGL